MPVKIFLYSFGIAMRKSPSTPAVLVSLAILAILMLPMLFFPMRQVIFLSQMTIIRNLDAGSQKIEKLIFTKDQYSRLDFGKEGREFRFNGSMYDIHSMEQSGDRIIVLALRDPRETSLLEVFGHQDLSGKATGPVPVKMGFLPYFRVDPCRPDFRTDRLPQPATTYITQKWSDPFTLIFSPPPELLT
ncbi:MAG: hypothetical protein V2A67_07230 [Bacteroidota bacterium]